MQTTSIRLNVTRNHDEEEKIFKVLEFEGEVSRENPVTNKEKILKTPTKSSRTPKTPRSSRKVSVASPQ